MKVSAIPPAPSTDGPKPNQATGVEARSGSPLGSDQLALSSPSLRLAQAVEKSPISRGLEKLADTWSEAEATVKVLQAVAGTSTGVGKVVAGGLQAANRPGVGKAVAGVQKVVPVVNVLTALIDRARTHTISHDPKASKPTKVMAGVTEGLSWGVVTTNVASMFAPARYKGPIQLVGLGMDLAGIGTGFVRDKLYAKDQAAASP